jgi:glycosyltransferase involved in cell wall biosynthesis
MVETYIEHSDWNCLPSAPLVTVVTPAYNHERYLREAIEGVAAQQTAFPIELVIGDDASIDRTRDIALEYQRAYPGLVRVLSGKRNVGMHENAARLVAAARGRYLAFCEGDDCWHRPDKLSAQIALLESDPEISLVCSSWRTISEEGAVLTPDVLKMDKACDRDLVLDDILAGRVKTVTVCTRTEVVRQALKESPLCRAGRYPFGDAPMWVEASRCGRCVCMPQAYATYRLSRDSATRPRDIMDVYRFIAGSCEFDRDAVGMYLLPQGERAAIEFRIRATRKRLRVLALLGDAVKVRQELRWLRKLGARAHREEYLLYAFSWLTQPGTLGSFLRRRVLLAWHDFAIWRKRNGSPSMVPRTEADVVEGSAVAHQPR